MKQFYIQLYSPHGLIRYENPEIGRDNDTGGQVKYLLELVEALSRKESVRKVDLFTRKITDKRVSPDYSKDIEVINDKARIVRIPCGGKTYRKKETLWNYMEEFVDNTIRFNNEQDDIPDIVHGHYADGGYIAVEISKFFEIKLISTGHSLGRKKKEHLLEEGMSEKRIEEVYNMENRINAEEAAIRNAELVITSTQHEIDQQYKGYEGFEQANFKVIPPGTNQDLFYPFYRQEMPSFDISIEQEQVLYKINREIDRFLFDSNKPLILSIGRPDARKNFSTIIEAYGNDEELKSMANLAIFAGVRKDISLMPEDEQNILTSLLLLMDKYDLYGKLAIPKKNDPMLEIPEIYRIAARKKGVFVNANPGENFGLTTVEAAACGLPVIASPYGGPKEILTKCENGKLVNVNSPEEIAKAIKEIITNNKTWETYSANGIKGVNKYYSWEAHTDTYLEEIKKINKTHQINIGRRLYDSKIYIISDLDGTLIDEEPQRELDEFTEWIEENKDRFAFGIATGRNKRLTLEAMGKHNLPDPDIVICSAGSKLYYTNDFLEDLGYNKNISYQWKREKIFDVMKHLPKLELQEEDAQSKFKLSYYVEDDFTSDDYAMIHKLLDDNKLKANVLLTDNKLLDFLPIRASKGNAIKYLAHKWKMPYNNFITAGNGGNDIDMLKGKARGIVVSNYSPELEFLKKSKGIYFAENPFSVGVLEGIKHYLDKG
ncbi:HAD-IIB family hydrolase [Portibacter lacus]|uniref:sucrose-phosphate synthase n=1 Tax=Portibacter lacus TaxID=1099794 RepID=A0AA37WG45_9BACT|nr:HAD-IIB family hydrolase [Portibacter lacus]GLR17655.1 sucrose-phosphate synthase [Portibacter lacus]